MAVKLIIDSTSNLSKEYLKEKDIDVVSLNIVSDDTSVKEVDIDNLQEYYNKMMNHELDLKTSQPSIQDFEDAMVKALDGDKNEVIVFTLSTILSGTNSCANLAKRGIDSNNLYVVDSGQTIQGFGLLIQEVVEMIENGKTAQEIIAAVPELSKRIHIYFVPSSLRWLRKGGRVGLVSAVLGSVLQIRPILNMHNGILKCAKKALGFGKALIELASLIPQKLKKLVLINAFGGENTNILRNALIKRNIKIDEESNELSLVVIAHVGPGAVGAAFITD